MLHDGIVNASSDESTTAYTITDLNNNATVFNVPTVHSGSDSGLCLFLKKGYKIRLSRNNFRDFMTIQYYLKRD